MRYVLAALAICVAASASAAGKDAMIGPDAWRELSTGKTLYYFKDGELYGKEYYINDEGDVVFRFPSGVCAEGKWAHSDGRFCFAFDGSPMLHCFWHVMRDDQIVVIGEADGEEQTVEKIVDDEPLGCGSAI
ncbi:MAG: hypothetical protein AAFP78_11815 [Pseudomonadota bacterium]